MEVNFILSDFLTQLGVPHTADYTNSKFAAMPFKTLFGLQTLLKSYNVESAGYRLDDKQDITQFATPFIAHTSAGFVIVTSISDGSISYLTQSTPEKMPLSDFFDSFDGVIFQAYPTSASREPDYAAHARMDFIMKAKKWVLAGLALLLFAYLFVTNRIYSHATTILLTVFDLVGLTLTYMLVQKSMKIKNKAADRVCAVLQKEGCDHVLELKASSFFGIFSWSELGFAYFSVSLLCLLIFPQWISYLAACNVCCLPFTVWSIWYQKFRAGAWCTLCVSVQCTLWILFICYLTGGWLQGIFPLRIEFFVLVATYGLALLGLNRIIPLMTKSSENNDTSQTNSKA